MGDEAMSDDEYAETIAGGRVRIDLAALAGNYRLIAARVAPARTAAVVKADGYGLGAAPVVATLTAAGCRDFFVVHLGEALVLRPALTDDARLFVLNGLMPGAEPLCAATDIIPVLNSLDQALRWRNAARAAGRPLPAVLQFDSGMSRLGVAPDEAARLAGDSDFLDWVDLRLVMSHLACADTPSHGANAAQLKSFEAMAALFPGVPRSFANSGGSFLDTAFHGDLVRPGIALYGGAPHDAPPNPMHAVVSLDARVIQIRTIPAGSGVGYGHDHIAERETRLATIAVGYADGLPRALSGRGAGWAGCQSRV